MIGQTVKHYRIVEELGGGGMGIVYRAEDTHLGRDVALKFLPKEFTRDSEARDRFKLEARAASALDHANICTIHDIDESEGGQLFIAMAFYAGETLKARLARGPLEIDEAADLGRQIAAGLDRAHEQGIVHRDIKPANVMITAHGDIKILDFGVAKLLGEAGLTRTGSTLGTLAYMSPEQVEGRELGPSSDLWSLGVVLYQALTGTLPFDGSRQGELVVAIVAQDPKQPRDRRSEIPEALSRLVVELLEKDPKRRPDSALAIVGRLEAILRPAGVESTTAVLKRPLTWVVAAAGVATLAAAVMLPARARARVDGARAALERVEALALGQRYAEAYALGAEIEPVLGEDSTLARWMPEVSDRLSVRSTPAGARIWLQTFEDGVRVGLEGGRTLLGATPIRDVRLPRGDHFLEIELEGHIPVERLLSSDFARIEGALFGEPFDLDVDVALRVDTSSFAEMVRVPGGRYTLVSADAPAGASADLSDFLIDRFEVTNEQFAEFIRAGGYADPSGWPNEINHDPVEPAVAGAVDLFRDRTRLPGPREWSGQRPAEGTDRHPVTGVTWYEAAAYCAYHGKTLPTLFEWEKAARAGAFTHVQGMVFPWGLAVPGESMGHRANFGGVRTMPVDAHPLGLSPYGAYAMAGNVREFILNQAGDGVVAMGGSWQDRSYQFVSIATLPPLFTSPGLGFRCAAREATPESHGAGRLALDRRSPSYEPVDEATYRSYLTHYRYDPVVLAAETLHTERTDDWIRQRVQFAGVGEDSVLAHLYLPNGADGPYQTMVFVASTSAFFSEPVDEQLEWVLGPNVRAGRAALGVVLDGMVGREWPVDRGFPQSNSVEFRELMVHHATELSLALDYLETRTDIDSERVAYVGLSWGAGSRATLAAIDDRWGAVVFLGAGIDERMHPVVPEALNVNFIPYIRAPTLMVNGRQDEEHPWLTRALPFWELLTGPKELVLRDGEGHQTSDEVRVPAINDFLDRTFGPVR